MNLFDVLNKGATHAPKRPKFTPAQLRGIKRMRENWLRTITGDSIRCWLDLGEKQAEVIGGMFSIFTFGYYAAIHDHGEQSPQARVIRGGMSAAAGAIRKGYTVDKFDALTFDATCAQVREVITTASDAAIVYANGQMQKAAQALA